MTTVTVTKKLNLLDVEDVRQALSRRFGREVGIWEVDCTLVRCIPPDRWDLPGAYLEFRVGDDLCDSNDLFWDDELGGLFLEGKRLSLDGPVLTEDEIFNFGPKWFNSFDVRIETG